MDGWMDGWMDHTSVDVCEGQRYKLTTHYRSDRVWSSRFFHTLFPLRGTHCSRTSVQKKSVPNLTLLVWKIADNASFQLSFQSKLADSV